MAIYEDYMLTDSLYGSEFRIIFWVFQPKFEDMNTKIMNEPVLEFYQDLYGRQEITSSCFEGM